jgi:meiotic recombination protein SPO11
VIFEEDGDLIDCTKMGVGGKAIPSLVSKIVNIRGDAEFVLLVGNAFPSDTQSSRIGLTSSAQVEKDAAFMRLAEDRFYNQVRSRELLFCLSLP